MQVVKYKIIADYLREQVAVGFFKGDSRIPSELVLSKIFKVSRMTARKSIEQLVAENVLYQISRQGSFVVNKIDKIEVHLEESLAFQRQQQDVESVVNKFQIIPASSHYQQLFDINSTDTVYDFSRIRYKQHNVFAYEQGVIPTKFLNLTPEILQNSLTEYFKTSGLNINKLKKEFKVITPCDEIATIFGNINNSAVFCIDFSRYLASNELFELDRKSVV